VTYLEALIFDCDGVLFESRGANLAYYNRILEQFSYPPVAAENHELSQFCHTASSPQVLEALVRREDLPAALAFAATLDYREFIPHMQPEEHLEEVLQTLSRQFPLAVATNRGGSIVPILDHFVYRDYFSAVVTSQDVALPKPAPDMLLLAAEKLGKKPQNCLFIGDSELDKQAAAAAGVPFAGYGTLVAGELTLSNHRDLLQYVLTENGEGPVTPGLFSSPVR
jgi:HAD superfamily hydrolase (TIGR01509 family)